MSVVDVMVEPRSPHVIVGSDDVCIDNVRIARPIDGGADLFREFTAPIDAYTESEQTNIGQITGWIGWSMLGEEPSYEPEHGLLISRIFLKPTHRGNRLTATVIERLSELLCLEPSNTLTLLYPEP